LFISRSLLLLAARIASPVQCATQHYDAMPQRNARHCDTIPQCNASQRRHAPSTAVGIAATGSERTSKHSSSPAMDDVIGAVGAAASAATRRAAASAAAMVVESEAATDAMRNARKIRDSMPQRNVVTQCHHTMPQRNTARQGRNAAMSRCNAVTQWPHRAKANANANAMCDAPTRSTYA